MKVPSNTCNFTSRSSGSLLSVCPPVASKLPVMPPAFCTIPNTQQVLGGSSQITSESYTDSNLQLIIMIIDTVQRVEPVFTGKAPRQMNTHSGTHDCTNSRGQQHEGGNARGSGPSPGCRDPLRQQASLRGVGGHGRSSVRGVPSRRDPGRSRSAHCRAAWAGSYVTIG